MNWSVKGKKKIIILALIVLLSFSLIVGCSNSTASEDKGTVKIGYVNWAECVAVSNLWQVILEDQGYTVELTQLDVAPLFVGLSEGDLDVFMDSWLPITHETYWTEYQDSLEDYGTWYEGSAKIGIVVPQYVTINSIEEMKDESDKFGNQIVGIDPGAGIMKATDRANESYDLGFEVLQSSESAMMAALDKAYQNNEWIAITGWSPHWMFAEYDLKYLDDPKGEYGESEEIHTLANKEFSTQQPEVAAMLKNFSMSDQQIGSLEALINEGMTPTEAAQQWIEENQDVVDSWIQ
jgi:glycine betaine/proline transport system substrate-binding protein